MMEDVSKIWKCKQNMEAKEKEAEAMYVNRKTLFTMLFTRFVYT